MTMSKKKIHVLQVGTEDWSQAFAIPESLEWHYLPSDKLSDFLKEQETIEAKRREATALYEEFALQPEANEFYLQELEKMLKVELRTVAYSILLLSDKNYPAELTKLDLLIDAHRLFYPSNWEAEDRTTANFLYKKVAQRYDWNKKEELIYTFSKALFSGQFGQKITLAELEISTNFGGRIDYEGQNYVCLEGDFGQDFQQIAYYRYNIQAYKDVFLNLFLNHVVEPSCAIKLNVQLIQDGSTATIVKEWSFEGKELREQLFLDPNENGYLFISIHAKGNGLIKIGSCHQRWSRNGLGEFVLGGERLVDDDLQEIYTFFHPMDFTPPLCVYFSGFREAEGFEGYRMIRGLNKPFMLICDPRLIGGAFYLGSEDLEQQIVQKIQEKLDYLGFNSSQLILSGISMGTFGATYYGADLHPYGVVLAKPVLSLGEVALMEKVHRPGGFATSIELLKSLYGDLSMASAERLNNRYWDKMTEGVFKNTQFAITYMKNEDYDASAFEKMIHYSKSTGATIHARGIAGRHNDAFGSIYGWFVNRYKAMIKNGFDTKEEAHES